MADRNVCITNIDLSQGSNFLNNFVCILSSCPRDFCRDIRVAWSSMEERKPVISLFIFAESPLKRSFSRAKVFVCFSRISIELNFAKKSHPYLVTWKSLSYFQVSILFQSCHLISFWWPTSRKQRCACFITVLSISNIINSADELLDERHCQVIQVTIS